MQPKIKQPVEKNSKDEKNEVQYTLKAGQSLPDEIKNALLPLSAVLRMELLSFLTKIRINLKTGRGSKKQLLEECSKYINLLQRKKKDGGSYGGTINRNSGAGNPHTRRLDGPKKR